MLTESDIQAALRDCFDLSLPCNIVDLGLVESIQLTRAPDAPGAGIPGVPAKYCVAIELVPTTLEEAAGAQLSAQIQNRLAGLEQVLRSDVTLLSRPVWTPQRITSAGRRLLGLDGNPNLVQISGSR